MQLVLPLHHPVSAAAGDPSPLALPAVEQRAAHPLPSPAVLPQSVLPPGWTLRQVNCSQLE